MEELGYSGRYGNDLDFADDLALLSQTRNQMQVKTTTLAATQPHNQLAPTSIKERPRSSE